MWRKKPPYEGPKTAEEVLSTVLEKLVEGASIETIVDTLTEAEDNLSEAMNVILVCSSIIQTYQDWRKQNEQ